MIKRLSKNVFDAKKEYNENKNKVNKEKLKEEVIKFFEYINQGGKFFVQNLSEKEDNLILKVYDIVLKKRLDYDDKVALVFDKYEELLEEDEDD